MVRFRVSDSEDDGPPIHSSRLFTRGWFVVSTLLALATIWLGLVSINALEPSDSPDLVIEVHAEQWKWSYTYVDYGLVIEDADELVLPIHQVIEFRITSSDVLHSFWIPGFRQKYGCRARPRDHLPGDADHRDFVR